MHDSPVRRPRLVATDLDGTLLRSDGAISPRTRAALRDVESAGIGVVFVTARPPRWLDPLADAVGGDGTVISANGAFDYDVRTRTVIASYPLERALLLEIVADLRAAVPGIGFSAELRDGVHTEPNYPELHPRWVPADLVPAPIDDLPPEAVVGKLLARTDHLPEEEVIPRVAEVLGDRALVQHSGTGGLAEISAPGVTKAAGLVRWCGLPTSGPRTCGPSETCPTTSRCSSGPESGGPSRTPTPTSARRRHARVRPTTRTESRGPWSGPSVSDASTSPAPGSAVRMVCCGSFGAVTAVKRVGNAPVPAQKRSFRSLFGRHARR